MDGEETWLGSHLPLGSTGSKAQGAEGEDQAERLPPLRLISLEPLHHHLKKSIKRLHREMVNRVAPPPRAQNIPA